MVERPRPRSGLVGTGLRLLVSLALLVGIALVADLSSILELLRTVDLRYVLPLLLVNTAAYLIFALRWSRFCRHLGLTLPFRGYLRGVYLFQVTSQVVPSPLLGEAGRFAAFPAGTSKRTILESIVLDRLSNQIALVGAVALLLPYYWTLDLDPRLRWLLPLPPLVTLLLLAFLPRFISRTAREGKRGLAFLGLLTGRGTGLRPLAYGLGLSAVLALEFHLAAAALPLSTPVPLSFLLLVPLLSLTLTLLPISFGDWGTRELVALAVLHATGLGTEDILAISLLVGVVNLACSLPGLLLAARGRRAISDPPPPPPR